MILPICNSTSETERAKILNRLALSKQAVDEALRRSMEAVCALKRYGSTERRGAPEIQDCALEPVRIIVI